MCVPDEPTLGKDQRAGGWGKLAQETSDHFFRMAQAVNRGCVDPVDAKLERVAHSRERSGVILRPPTEGPTSAADGPRAKADSRDFKSAGAQRTGNHESRLWRVGNRRRRID